MLRTDQMALQIKPFTYYSYALKIFNK
uniref:Uncharacterized protein n=1 Tax=Anguilla anguilla TaxID=7936 RepID=A0A0E9XVQ8_ANGAN